MAIEYTHRTAEGRKARILCTDALDPARPVVALICNKAGRSEELVRLTSDFKLHPWREEWHLRESSVWEDVAVDTPVWVVGKDDGRYKRRHFAQYRGGEVWVWTSGLTSHSGEGLMGPYATTGYPASSVFLEKPADA